MRTEGAPFAVKILDLTHDCQGVADVDGRRVFDVEEIIVARAY